MSKIVYLRIASWAGRLWYAEHYYGTLWRDGKEEILKYNLTERDAARLNRETPDAPESARYRAGEESERFFSEEKLRKEAVRKYKEMFPGATILIDGKHCICDPQEVLDGPEPLKTQLNELFREAEKIGWWDDGPREVMEAICGNWEETLKEAA